MIDKYAIIIRNANFFDFGGGEKYPVLISEILNKNGYKTLVVSRSPRLLDFAKSKKVNFKKGIWWKKQNFSGKNIIFFPIYLIWQIFLTIWYLILFVTQKPTVIHIQSKDDFIAGTIAGKILRIRVIWTDHADLKHIFKNHKIFYKNPIGKLVYLCAKLTDQIMLVSNSELKLVKNNLNKNSSIISKFRIVHNGANDDFKKYSKTKNEKVVFSVVSRLVSDKGINEAIEAFNKLHDENKDIQLNIVGDGPEAEYFKNKSKENKDIIFTGYQNEPLKFLSNSDIFIHSTYHEGFSLALVEACMLGKPIIATAVGGNVEIITDKINGLLIKPKNTDSLFSAMKLLLNDNKNRDNLGKKAREVYLNNFIFKNIVVNKIIPIYEGNYEN